MRLRKRFLLALFMVLCVGAFAQQAEKTELPNETELVFADAESTTEQSQGTEVFSVGSILRLIVAIAFVIGLLVLLMRFLKKAPHFSVAESPYLKVVAGVTVAAGKSVQVVTLGRKGYLIGSSEAGLSLIAEIDDQEIIDAMNLESEKHADVPKRDFFSMVAPFFGGLKKGSEKDFASEAFLSSERDRLNKAFSSQEPRTNRDEDA